LILVGASQPRFGRIAADSISSAGTLPIIADATWSKARATYHRTPSQSGWMKSLSTIFWA